MTDIIRQPHSTQRIHAFDNLRSLSITLIVFVHVSLNYMVNARYYNFAANPEYTSFAADIMVSVVSLFVMPLLWITTGFFIEMQAEKRGITAMARTRLRSFGLPLLILGPPILIAMYLIYELAIAMSDNPVGYWTVFSQTVRAHLADPIARIPYISLRHLWYLYFGAIYVCVLYVVYETKPFRALLAVRPASMFLLCAAVIATVYMSDGELTITPDSRLFPNPLILLYYFMFVLLGLYLSRHRHLIFAIAGKIGVLFLICAVSVPTLYYVGLTFLTVDGNILPDKPALAYGVVAVMYTVTILTAPLLVMSLVIRFYNRSNAIVERVNRSSFWVYIIHYPITKAMFCLMFFVDLPALAKLGMSFLIVCALSVGSYYLLVKGTAVQRLLDGQPLRRVPVPG